MAGAIAKAEPLRILLLEDTPDDANLALQELRSAGFDCVADIVSDWEHFRELAGCGAYEALLGDYELLRQSGPDAIHSLRQAGIATPVILLTRDTLGEELAAACFEEGATDCVLKARPDRLPLTLRRALEAAPTHVLPEHTEQQWRASKPQHTPLIQNALDCSGQRAQRTETAGKLARNILHDFNNLLMIIRGCAELLDHHKNDPERVGQYIQQIHGATSIAASGVQRLMTLNRKQLAEPCAPDLNSVLRDLGRILRLLMGEGIAVDFDYAEPPATVSGERSKIEQIILSLALNSRNAMPHGGKMMIETAHIVLNDAQAAEYCGAKLAPGSYVRLTIADTGVGMDQEVKARVFNPEPLFTNKAKGKGSRLGLPAAYAIIQEAGGDIVVHSAPGRGTAFTIYLPAQSEQVEARKPLQEASPANPIAPQTVLLVEHDASQREVAREYLQSRGYQVVTADNGLAAQELCQAYAGPIDVLITGLGGNEFASNARKARPELRVVLVAGEADPEFSLKDIGCNAVLLRKPYSLVELGQRIRVLASHKLAMGALEKSPASP